MEYKKPFVKFFDATSLPTYFQQFDVTFLERTVNQRMQSLHVSNWDSYLKLLLESAEEKSALENMLSNSHSLFFRNTLTFSVLEYISLPTMLLDLRSNKVKELRIWSTSCAAGQEAYSIAILLEELKKNSNIDFSYRIFATDLSEAQIELAKEGIYSASALGNTSLKRIETWFDSNRESYTIKKSLKENIVFSTFDLLNEQLNFPPESVFGEFNLVFCANILFYYAPQQQHSMLQKLRKVLVSNGCLVTGETERGLASKNGFVEKYQQSAIYRMK